MSKIKSGLYHYRKKTPRPKRGDGPHTWTNRRSDGTYVSKGKNWTAHRNMLCKSCERKYRYFRAALVMTALSVLRAEQSSRKRRHVSIRTFLGKRREFKLAAWIVHQELCELKRRWNAGEDFDEETLERVQELEASHAWHFVDWSGKKRLKEEPWKRRPK